MEEKYLYEEDELLDNWEHVTPKGVYYEVREYEGEHHRRFNIRKYGGRKSFNIFYSHCID